MGAHAKELAECQGLVDLKRVSDFPCEGLSPLPEDLLKDVGLRWPNKNEVYVPKGRKMVP
jgi:hypothetical protein